MKRRPGLAIIEVLLTLALIAVLASFTAIISQTAIRNAEFDRIRETIRTELTAAQADTIAGTYDSAWGVAFSSSTITRYSGASYATRNSSFDRVTALNPETITLSGTTSVSFLRPSGTPSASSTVTLTNGFATATVSVTTAGAITIQ